MQNSKGKIVNGLIWSFFERICAQLVTTLVTIILARLLVPEYYGIISLVTVFITLMNVFVTGGFGSALVQKKTVDDLDYNSALIVSFSLSVVLYIVLFFVAPLIADFYDNDILTPVIRVMSIRLPIAAINTIQQANVQINMAFRKFFFSTIIGTIISGIIGVLLAYLGYGVWALVAQYLINMLISTVCLFFICSWKPKLQFSFQRAKAIWSFGYKVLLTQLVYTLSSDIKSLIIGKKFSTADLSYYDQGKKYPALFVNNLNASINKVMLPAFSKEQDNIEQLCKMLRRATRTGIFILVPLLLGFAMVAENFVYVVLTEKWLPCVPFIQLYCLYFLTRPIESSCHQALISIGKNTTCLICMIIINVVDLSLAMFAIFYFKSVVMIAVFSILTTLTSLIVFLSFSRKYIHYKFRWQLADVLPSLLLGLVMSVVVYLIGLIDINKILVLIMQVCGGGLVYVALAFILKLEPFTYLLNFVLSKIKKPVKKEI